jgi:outer membrane protein assembly factor BamD (BamD/ComL family)
MNIKNIIITAIVAVIWIGPAVAAGTSPVLSVERSLYPADADQELDQFFKAKESLFGGDWPQARKRLEKFLKDFPNGRMRDEALFWLAKSLSGCAARETSLDAAAALKKEAFRTLERLGREHPESLWKNDAEAMRIEIAGELVLLGAKEYEGFIHEYAASQKTDETALKLTALNSLIRLEPETAFTALVSGLEKEPDPRIRKKCATLLGQNYTEEALPALEKASRSDQDPDVRTEAAYWIEQIRIRMIPAEMSYYLLAARATGDAARGRIKENVVNRFSVARTPTRASGARRIISQYFDNQVGGFEFAASSERAANAFMSQLEMSISHRIHDFQVSIIPGSIRKSPGRVTGEILFIDRVSGARLSETFAVDNRNDQIFAARRGDEAAVMLIQFEPVAGGAPAEAEDEGGSSAIGRLMSRIFGGRSAGEPVYSTFYTNFMGCRVHSTLQSTSTNNLKSNIQDFSLAKVELPAKGEAKGAWVLTGHVLGLKKERTFKARQASLIDPTGRIAAIADEITVAVDDPAGFRVQGSRLADKGVAEMVKKAKIAPPPIPESRGETEAREQTCELENGIKVFYSAAEKIGAAELGGPLVEFGRARVEITVPEGTWVLSGIIRLISSGSLFFCENSTLTDPRGNVRAKDAKLLVPMKKPHQYTLIDR